MSFDIKNISETTSPEKRINITLMITDYCNFGCNYCTTGKKFTGKSMTQEHISQSIDVIKKIKRDYKVRISISGGEPTLHKDFFIIIQDLLQIDEIMVTINTNGVILREKKDELLKLMKFTSKSSFCFNMTYHYEDNKKDNSNFIESLKILEETGVLYSINFLIPDDYPLEEYKVSISEIKKHINKGTYRYNLIKRSNDAFTQYPEEVINFATTPISISPSNKKNIEKINEITKDEMVLMNHEGNQETKLTSYVLNNGLSHFKGWKCSYVGKNYTSFHVLTSGEVVFGFCNTLRKYKLSLTNLADYILGGEKYTICRDNVCSCDPDMILEKKKNDTFLSQIQKYEKLMYNFFQKQNFGTEIQEVTVSIDTVQMRFHYYDLSYNFVIEKIIDSKKYIYSTSSIGLYFFIVNSEGKKQYEKNLSESQISELYKLINQIQKSFKVYRIIFEGLS